MKNLKVIYDDDDSDDDHDDENDDDDNDDDDNDGDDNDDDDDDNTWSELEEFKNILLNQSTYYWIKVRTVCTVPVSVDRSHLSTVSMRALISNESYEVI